MYLLIDSSFLYALYNIHDDNYQTATAFMSATRLIPLVPKIILPEVTYLFLRDVGHLGMTRFVNAFAKTSIALADVERSDLVRAGTIMTSYASARFDLVDCCIMALAERLRIEKIATYDRRDFSIMRPTHCDYFELIP